MKKLNEFNVNDLYSFSDEEIHQSDGFKTINRRVTSDYINSYSVSYEANSYYNRGEIEFTVRGRRQEMRKIGNRVVYGFKDGEYKYIKDPKRAKGTANHTVIIKPKHQIDEVDDLNKLDVDIYCSCNDFRYVFMNMAYNGHKMLANKINEYGLVPISYGSDDQPAVLRNPHNMGALCKHVLLVIEQLKIDRSLRKRIQKDITDRRDSMLGDLPVTELPKDDLVDFKDRYYDRDGRLKHKSKIKLSRDKKIQQVIDLIRETEYSGLKNYKGDFESSYDDFRKNMLQILMDFDSVYLEKAEKEGSPDTKYLPDNYQFSYDDISYELDKAMSVISYSTDMTDATIDHSLDKFDDDEIDAIDRGLDTILDPNYSIDDLFNSGGDNVFDKLLGESFKHINNYKDFKKSS